jgi:hypothetical protein
MNIVNPINFLGGLGWYDIQINYDRFLAATNEHTAQRFLAAGVDLLVWHKGWHINKIARTCVGHILKVLAPPHARPPAGVSIRSLYLMAASHNLLASYLLREASLSRMTPIFVPGSGACQEVELLQELSPRSHHVCHLTNR